MSAKPSGQSICGNFTGFKGSYQISGDDCIHWHFVCVARVLPRAFHHEGHQRSRVRVGHHFLTQRVIRTEDDCRTVPHSRSFHRAAKFSEHAVSQYEVVEVPVFVEGERSHFSGVAIENLRTVGQGENEPSPDQGRDQMPSVVPSQATTGLDASGAYATLTA